VLLASAIFRTALVPKPQFVKEDIKLVVNVNNPYIPMPLGPSNMAINFDRITPINILNTCTPPNREVAFKLSLYELLSFAEEDVPNI
jgi:hypothetical protein